MLYRRDLRFSVGPNMLRWVRCRDYAGAAKMEVLSISANFWVFLRIFVGKRACFDKKLVTCYIQMTWFWVKVAMGQKSASKIAARGKNRPEIDIFSWQGFRRAASKNTGYKVKAAEGTEVAENFDRMDRILWTPSGFYILLSRQILAGTFNPHI